jgi:hypothetical protein
MLDTLEKARANAAGLLADTNFFLCAIVTEDDGESYDCWPLHYYEVCPGAHDDTPKLDERTIRGFLPLVSRDATIVSLIKKPTTTFRNTSSRRR